jgi:hypothetical protein
MITATEATLMRLNLLSELDREPFVDIQQKFVDKMFTDTEHLERWAKGSNVTYEKLTLTSFLPQHSHWIRFRKV